MWITLNNNLKAAGEKLINNHQDAIEPQMPLIFNALKKVKVADIKVVILGQDPTPQEGKAKGVAFLVDNPRTVPAVLNMLLEVAFEGFAVDLDRANVEEWLEKGVLLLNTAFTVPHKDKDKDKNKNKQQGKGKKKIILICGDLLPKCLSLTLRTMHHHLPGFSGERRRKSLASS